MDEPSKKSTLKVVVPPTPAKAVLKSISLNTNIGFPGLIPGQVKSKSPPDYNNNKNSKQNGGKMSTDYYFSSSTSSPVSQRDSSSSSSSSSLVTVSSVVIPAFKCKSSAAATSIYVEPNETNLEPLTEKDYPQYKLFPPALPTNNCMNTADLMLVDMELDDKSIEKISSGNTFGSDCSMLPPATFSQTQPQTQQDAVVTHSDDGLFSPPLPLSSCPSSSPSSSCCSRTTSSSMNSPDYSSMPLLQRRSSPFTNKFFFK